MFITRRNFVLSVVCLSSLLTCGHLYPMRNEADRLYGNYDSMAKRSPSVRDSLLSALLMAEMPRDSSSQRKKAVDSTFIRFGRSSSGNSPKYDDSSMASPDVEDAESPKNGFFEGNKMASTASYAMVPSRLTTSRDDGCLVRNKSDLYLVLMGKSCITSSSKVKRENVNDTFIRFGKRDVQSTFQRVEGSDKDIKYGR